MDLLTAAFYAFALLTLASAGIVVFSRNIIYSAFALLFTFFGVAGIYILLTIDWNETPELTSAASGWIGIVLGYWLK